MRHSTEIEVLLKNGTTEDLVDVLPHGSGIDCKWEFETNGKVVYCHNSFHCMDENGYYCGYADFSISFPLKSTDLRSDFKLHFHGTQSQYLNQRHMLRDYLEDTFYWGFENVKKVWSHTV